LQTGGFDFFQIGLQLNQLLFAIRSPTCRAVEDQGDIAFFQEFLERSVIAILVLEVEARGLDAYLEAGFVIRRLLANRMRCRKDSQQQAAPCR
jgi:hypothetical protein